MNEKDGAEAMDASQVAAREELVWYFAKKSVGGHDDLA